MKGGLIEEEKNKNKYFLKIYFETLLFEIFTQSIDAIDVTSVTQSRLNSINASDVTRVTRECQMLNVHDGHLTPRITLSVLFSDIHFFYPNLMRSHSPTVHYSVCIRCSTI